VLHTFLVYIVCTGLSVMQLRRMTFQQFALRHPILFPLLHAPPPADMVAAAHELPSTSGSAGNVQKPTRGGSAAMTSDVSGGIRRRAGAAAVGSNES